MLCRSRRIDAGFHVETIAGGVPAVRVPLMLEQMSDLNYFYWMLRNVIGRTRIPLLGLDQAAI